MTTFQKQNLLYALRKTGTQKNFESTMQNIDKNDLLEVIEAMYTTQNLDSQCMLLSILAAYLLQYDGLYADLIVTNKYLYDKVQDILSIGQSQNRTIRILQFILALLSTGEREEKNTQKIMLALRARNSLRFSGCLATMCNMFTDCMMYQDTWIVLCHCLAEICKGCEMNQNYCSHLIPLCIKKIQNGNSEVLQLLQSLLENNVSNVQLFLRSDGVTIFTREILQSGTGMLLLNTVVETSPDIYDCLDKSGVIKHLQYFVQRYGDQSQIRQWANIILYQLSSQNKDCLTNTNNLNLNKINNKNMSVNVCDIYTGSDDDHVNTAQLFQNIFKEFANWKPINNTHLKKPLQTYSVNSANKIPTRLQCIFEKNEHKNRQQERYIESFPMTIPRQVESLNNCPTDLSFSSVIQDMHGKEKTPVNINFQRLNIESRQNFDNMKTNNIKTRVTNRRDTEGQYFNKDINEIDTESTTSFRPIFTSTPKQQPKATTSNIQTLRSFAMSSVSKSMQRSIGTQTSKVIKSHKRKRNKINMSPIKEMNKSNNKSMSARLFSAINDSCTTLVKSVRNIFKAKEKVQKVNSENKTIENRSQASYTSACSYKFTNYMRMRDAKAKENSQTCDEFSRDNSCNTCDNTTVLKQKLANDEYLKEAVKKLKFGIYLYGCDFKKISRGMFKNERYMTPRTLYTIYRKLIVK